MTDERMNRALELLREGAQQLVAQVEHLSQGNGPTLTKIQRLRALVDEIDQAVMDLPGGDEGSFSEFFRTVGESMIRAQDLLDQESQTRIDAGSTTGAGPSAYLIPEVKADLKFAARQTSGKRLNVFIYSEEEKVEKLHQQSVSFTVKAVPPLPREPSAEKGRSVLRETSDRQLRKALRLQLEKARETAAPEQQEAFDWLLETWPRAITLRIDVADSAAEYAIMASKLQGQPRSLRTQIWFVDAQGKVGLEYENQTSSQRDFPFSQRIAKMGLEQERAEG